MADPFVAEIRLFPFNFAPRGWAFCDGQLLPLSQNTALFSLLGTTYGGNGKSNFALPDMQGNTPMFWGQGPGLSLRDIGETGGTQSVSLLSLEMPNHAHSLNASGAPADAQQPENFSPARVIGATPYRPPAGAALVSMSDSAVAYSGADQPHNNMMPYLTVNFCIALQGVFPPRT